MFDNCIAWKLPVSIESIARERNQSNKVDWRGARPNNDRSKYGKSSEQEVVIYYK